jgi:hypothetical protein
MAAARPKTCAGKLSAFPLGTVLGTRLLAVGHALRIENAAHYVIADARQITDAAATHQDDRVFLEVVAFARNVRGNLDSIGKADAGHLAESGVRLLGGHDFDLKANSAFLRTAEKGRMLRPAILLDARLTHQLIYGWHSLLQGRNNPIFTQDSPTLHGRAFEVVKLFPSGRWVKGKTGKISGSSGEG